MKKILVVFLCACTLYTGFWLFRAYHLKKFIILQIEERGPLERAARRNLGLSRPSQASYLSNGWQGTCHPLPERRISLLQEGVLQYCEMRCTGFPFSVDVHLKDPKLKALFQLDGDLTLGTSLFARKGWLKISGNGKASLFGKEIEFSGTMGCKHHNLWQLIWNKNLFSQPTHKNLARLLPKLTLFADAIALKYQGHSLSADHVFAQNRFDRDESHTLQLNIRGAQTSLEALQKYYFNEKCDLTLNLILKEYSEKGYPKLIETQDLCVEDKYFRHKFSGVIKILNEFEGDLSFQCSQAVKKEYNPDLQKEHLSRIVTGIGSAFSERRLFGLICGSGDIHFTYDELKNWSLELQKCSWKLGRYRMDLMGKANGSKTVLDVHFHYYPELKLFIAKKLSNVSKLLALIESQGSIEEQTNTLNLQLQFEGPTGWRIGRLPISEITSLLQGKIDDPISL